MKCNGSQPVLMSSGTGSHTLVIALLLVLSAIGAVAQAAQNTTTNYGYDAQGNLKTITDPRGLVTTLNYDELNRRVLQISSPAIAGGTVPTVATGYDGLDQAISVTDPRGLATSYTVDGFGNLTQQQSPDTGDTGSTYDEAGNLKTRTDARGKITSYTYDALNRLIQISYPTGPASVFEYDGGTAPQPYDTGHLTTISDESGSTRFNYDAFGHLVQKTQTTGSGTSAGIQTLKYSYGANGKLDTVTYPSGTLATYGYDLAGRVSSLILTQPNGGTPVTSTLVSNIAYSPFGAPTGWTWGNGTPYSHSVDLDGRVNQYPLGALQGAGTLAATPGALARIVNYDPASRISGYSHADSAGSTTSPLATGANQSFGYDDLNRLTRYAASTTGASYSYDLTGNRTSFSSDTYVIDPFSNRLNSTFGASPPKTNLYDPAGNLTSDGTVGYTYSDRGRLATASLGADTVNYAYNALGQRVLKTGPATLVPTGAARYVYDQTGHLIGEYDSSGNPLTETVYLGDSPLAVLQSPGPLYYVYADHLNTPRVITRASDNQMVWRWDQAEPFGIGQPDQNPSGLGTFVYNLRFPGQYYDPETGLHDNGFRDYDPAIGRYVESDPIGLGGGINTYAYVGNNPVGQTDLNGLFAIPIAIPPPPPGGQSTGVGGYDWTAPFWPEWVRDLFNPPDDGPMLFPAPGNVADTQIVRDYNDYASEERRNCRNPDDRCVWLSNNKGRYRPDQVKATEKAWGCRRSRAGH